MDIYFEGPRLLYSPEAFTFIAERGRPSARWAASAALELGGAPFESHPLIHIGLLDLSAVKLLIGVVGSAVGSRSASVAIVDLMHLNGSLFASGQTN